jgi:hypothetical protein
MAAPLSWSVRCRAWSKRAGRRCANWSVRGGYTCRIHGGASPQARAAAERRWTVARLERKLGRPLRPTERSWVTQDSSVLRRELSALLAEVKADEASL